MYLRTIYRAFFVVWIVLIGVERGHAAVRLPTHGIAMHGDLKYFDPKAFSHFEARDPRALKGGSLNLAIIGKTFDTCNPFLLRGIPAAGLGLYQRLPFDTLMERAPDEPFSLYGRLAESVEMPADRSWMIFNIRPEARFNDDKKMPVTARDVAFTFRVLHQYGPPARKILGKKVEKVEILGEYKIKFSFRKVAGQYDRELPLVLAWMPILSEKSLRDVSFDKTGLTPLVGSGPYKIEKIEPGKRVVYRRVLNYWGKGLPVTRGAYNFDSITYHYFHNEFAAFEAFKRGEVDYWRETDPNRWETGYTCVAVSDGHIIRETVKVNNPFVMTGLIFNSRKFVFSNIRVRQALGFLLDFEWLNNHLLRGSYECTRSFFHGTELEARGLPSAEEKKLLARLPDIPETVWGPLPVLHQTDGTGNLRQEIRHVQAVLKESGWIFKGNRWVHSGTGIPFSFEILLGGPRYQRIAESFARALQKVGIEVRVRIVDNAEYQSRLQKNAFDMIVHPYGHSLSPGCEQRLYWSAAHLGGYGRNYAGVNSKAVDGAIDALLSALTREELVVAVQALDRLLRHGHYLIPLFHKAQSTFAYWKHIKHPIPQPGKDIPDLHTWWGHPNTRYGE